MKRFIYFTMCLCSMLVAVSCSNKADNELIGKWEQTVEQMGVKAELTYDFKNNGKMTQTLVMKNDYPKINIVADGTCSYTYSDDIIKFKFSSSDFNFDVYEIEGMSEEEVAAGMEAMKSGMVMEQEFTDVKIEGDKMTAKFNGQKITLKRI